MRYKHLSIVTAVLVICCMVLTSGTQAVQVEPQPSYSIFMSGKDVTLKWSKVASAKKYHVTVYDLKAKKNLVSANIPENTVIISGTSLSKASSYKIIVKAYDDSGKVLRTYTNYFHVEKVVVTPSGSSTPKSLLVSGYPQKESLESSSSPSPTPASVSGASSTLYEQSEMQDYLRDNTLFKDGNSNKQNIWFNEPLNEQFFTDAKYLEDSDEVGLYAVDFGLEKSTFLAINAYRRSLGLSKLIWNDNLARMARVRAMAHIYEKVENDHDLKVIYGYPDDSMIKWGLKPTDGQWRENICWAGSKDGSVKYGSQDFMELWIESPEHNANLKRDATSIGIGVIMSNRVQKNHIGYDVAFISAK